MTIVTKPIVAEKKDEKVGHELIDQNVKKLSFCNLKLALFVKVRKLSIIGETLLLSLFPRCFWFDGIFVNFSVYVTIS